MTSPRPRHPLLRVALAHLAAGVAVLAACESRLPTSAELEHMDVATVEKRLDIVADSTTTYYVDDMKVTAAEAHEVGANRIVSVLVSKQPHGGAGSREVRILTNDGPGSPDAGVTTTPEPSAEKVQVNFTKADEARFEGVFEIDGVRSSARAMHGIAPSRILTIDVIKGARARQLYPGDTTAAKGVIRVTTKPSAP